MSARSALCKAGIALLVADFALYIIGIIHLQLMIGDQKPLQTTLEVGARYCVLGGALAITTIPLLLFARGWKRIPLVVGSLILIPLFVGLTLD